MNFSATRLCNRALSKTSKLIHRRFIPLTIHSAVHNTKLGIVQRYLSKKYSSLIEAYKNLEQLPVEDNLTNQRIIWVCWLQGLEQAPDVVKKCIGNLQLFHGENCTIHLITLKNYHHFVTLPQHIEEKFQEQRMKPAHFSDVLRLCLLAKYGGVWIDSTVLILKPLPDDVFRERFFTLKSQSYDPASSISGGKWTTFFIASASEYLPVLFLRDLLIQYWQDHDTELDYFLFDHAISIAYQQLPAFKYQIDKLGYFGNHRHLLMPLLLKEYSEEANRAITEDPVQIYKLTYKINLQLATRHHSFYRHYIQ